MKETFAITGMHCAKGIEKGLGSGADVAKETGDLLLVRDPPSPEKERQQALSIFITCSASPPCSFGKNSVG